MVSMCRLRFVHAVYTNGIYGKYDWYMPHIPNLYDALMLLEYIVPWI